MKRLPWILIGIAVLVIVGVIFGNEAVRIHFLQETGITNSASRAYNFWSGFAGSNVLVLVTLGAFYYQHTCHHSNWDLRWGQQIEGTAYRACHKHHPGRLEEHRSKRSVGEDVMREAWERHRAAVRAGQPPNETQQA
jgi:hypothetical protein